jgi:hypothetical protein
LYLITIKKEENITDGSYDDNSRYQWKLTGKNKSSNRK